MYLKKILILLVGAVLLSATAYAQDTSLQLDNKNAFAIKLGYKWYADSDVFNFWYYRPVNKLKSLYYWLNILIIDLSHVGLTSVTRVRL